MSKSKDESDGKSNGETPSEELPELSRKETKALRDDVKHATRTYEQTRAALRRLVRLHYDFQHLRLAAAGRGKSQGKDKEITLHKSDIAVLTNRAKDLMRNERAVMEDVKALLSTVPFYVEVLEKDKVFRGLGPTMAAVILAEFDVYIADTVSKFWAFAGLVPVPCRRCTSCHAVVRELLNEEDAPLATYIHIVAARFKDDEEKEKERKTKCRWAGTQLLNEQTYASGQAMRPEKGKKRPYNAFLKTKLVGVLADSIIKATTYHCAACQTRVVKKKDVDPEADPIFLHSTTDGAEEGVACAFEGHEMVGDQVHAKHAPYRRLYEEYKHRKESAGWGMSDGHRHRAALRYMVKQLLIDVHKRWRVYENLPVRPPYSEEKLGHVYSGPSITADE
jgi:hypothetical protein